MNTTSLVSMDESRPFTTAEIAVFEKQYMAVCEKLSDMVKQKKALEDQEKEIKKKLGEAMDEYGIKSMDNQFIRFTRVAASEGKQTVDLDKLAKAEPDLFKDLLADYPKVTGARKASVRFEAK